MPDIKLDGVHHFTGVTADVTANVDFWCRILGLRFVKKTLNFETTFRYHTYYGDEEGRPGSVVTFLEFNELERQRPGSGNIHRIVLRVGSAAALDFWLRRLAENQVYSEMLRLDPTQPTRLIFEDFEGHEVELMVSDAPDAPRLAEADDIPPEYQIRGIEGARSYTSPEALLPFAEHLGFSPDRDRLVLRGDSRSARWYFSTPPDLPFQPLAPGVWHHIALDAGDHLESWREHANRGLAPFTQVFDHYFFNSCYSVSPGGLVELCSYGPGFTLDQKLEDLGEGAVSLSPWTEPLRARLEQDLTPIHNPRSRKAARRPRTKDNEAAAPIPGAAAESPRTETTTEAARAR
ncbi:MAG: glyoxalase/bleomycin resistance protein/dioxygenase [Actinomycetia bacterium]|nr:glyoxalase/bleomycin resistance protein/dioxygenase [Actinomycetes bacterium]